MLVYLGHGHITLFSCHLPAHSCLSLLGHATEFKLLKDGSLTEFDSKPFFLLRALMCKATMQNFVFELSSILDVC